MGQAIRRSGIAKRPAPIVLLMGPHGSGGTVLLDRLWEEYREDCPGVRLNLAQAEEVHHIVLAVLQGLRHKIPGIRALRFPRLELAYKALGYGDDGGGRLAFIAYMKTGGAADAAEAVKSWGERAGALLGSPDRQAVAAFAGQALSWLITHAGAARGPAAPLAWFAQPGKDSYDVLWELYRHHHDNSAAAERSVGRTLCAALLADLRADFNERSRLHGQRTRNCLVLLDDCDSKPASLFLELIEECRRESAQADESGDPLVVLAVVHRVPKNTVGRAVSAASEAVSLASAQATGGWWYPIRLTDLSAEDLVEMTASNVLGSSRRDADFVFSLTGGHPAASRRLVVQLAASDTHGFGAPGYDADSVLGNPPATAPGGADGAWSPQALDASEEEHLLRCLFPDEARTLGPWRPDGDCPGVLAAMAVCAATPGVRATACQAVFRFLGWAGPETRDARDLLVSHMWLVQVGGGAEVSLHPAARLLLRRLMARVPGVWDQVHQGFASHYSTRADSALRQYHHLAQVDLEHPERLRPVATFLDAETESRSPGGWIQVCDCVTAAPVRIRSTRDPRALVNDLAGVAQPSDRARVVARLAVARWLYGDRLLDPGRRLAGMIATEYDHLAQLYASGGDVFFDESVRYRVVEREWEG